MSVFRVHKTENYTVMSNYHLRDTSLSLKAKGLLSLMLSLPENWDYSARGLSTLSKDGEDAIKSTLNELEEHKYLTRTPIREKGVIRDWQYDIYENPETLENITSEPEGDFPLMEKPVMEKQSQINTNKLNTKEENSKSTNVDLEQPAVTRKPLIKSECANDTATPTSNKRKNIYEKCADAIDNYTEDTEIRDRLKEYLPIRLARKEMPLSLPSFKGMLNRLTRISTTKQEQLAIIQQAIDRQYPTFYELRTYKKYGNGQDKSVFSEYGKVRTGNSGKGVITNVQF